MKWDADATRIAKEHSCPLARVIIDFSTCQPPGGSIDSSGPVSAEIKEQLMSIIAAMGNLSIEDFSTLPAETTSKERP